MVKTTENKTFVLNYFFFDIVDFMKKLTAFKIIISRRRQFVNTADS